jgi:hypothetical protein
MKSVLVGHEQHWIWILIGGIAIAPVWVVFGEIMKLIFALAFFVGSLMAQTPVFMCMLPPGTTEKIIIVACPIIPTITGVALSSLAAGQAAVALPNGTYLPVVIASGTAPTTAPVVAKTLDQTAFPGMGPILSFTTYPPAPTGQSGCGYFGGCVWPIPPATLDAFWTPFPLGYAGSANPATEKSAKE